MYRSRTGGFSIVELLVAMVIGLIGSIIIFQVYGAFEGQKRSTTSGGDTQTNIAVATNALERSGRHSGYGINFKSHMGCDALVWKQDATPPIPPAVADPGQLSAVKLVPANIRRDAGGNFLDLTFAGSNNDSAYAVTKLSNSPIDSDADVKLGNIYGVAQGDLLIFAEKKDATAARLNKITCAVMQVRQLLPDPLPAGTIPDTVVHTSGRYNKTGDPFDYFTQYNRVGGLGTLTDAHITSVNTALDLPLPLPTDAATRFKFTPKAFVMNVGQPSVGSSLGMRVSTYSVSNGRLLENGNPVVDGIVFMEAQYGMADSPNSTTGTVTYMRTMPEDATRDPKVLQDDWFRLRTVRVVIIARSSQYEKEMVSPASFTVWSSPLSVTYTLPTAQDRHYRYKVVEMVIPLRNMFWRPPQ
jgi:type IV pilus assembly protein PilW